MSNLKVMGAGAGYTLISNTFIDQYMATAGSSHLKTYLLLQRLFSDPAKEISVSGMADILDCSESDILRSLRYWEKKGLMDLQFAAAGGELIGILLKECTSDTAHLKTAEEEMAVSRIPASAAAASYKETTAEVSGLQNSFSKTVFASKAVPERKASLNPALGDERFAQFIYLAQQYIGAPLSRNDSEIFVWMYDALKMPPELMEYLVEYCVTKGHRSVRYMEKVARDWYEKEIHTVEQARSYTPIYSKNLYTVMKALGLSGRQAAPSEQQKIESWCREFPVEMVVEACNRTIVAIHEPSWSYVDSILANWKKEGITSLQDLQVLDEEFQKKKDKPEKKETGSNEKNQKDTSRKYYQDKRKPGARFHNFDQRTYDYEELMKNISAVD